MSHQIVSLRRLVPILFGDERSEQRYLREVAKAWREQRVRWAVAPRCTLRLADGRLLTAGEPVRLADLDGFLEPASPGYRPRRRAPGVEKRCGRVDVTVYYP